MENRKSGNEPPAGVRRLTDKALRKKQDFRRHLQDPASPGFLNPARASLLAGIDLSAAPSREPQSPDLPRLWANFPSVRNTLNEATLRKAAFVQKLRERISEGMNATKNVTEYHRGTRHTITVPDQAERRRWTRLGAEFEGLYPKAGGGNDDELLARELTHAVELETALTTDEQFTPADRVLLREGFTALERLQDLLRREVFIETMGMSPEAFGKQMEEKMMARWTQLWSGKLDDVAQATDVATQKTSEKGENE